MEKQMIAIEGEAHEITKIHNYGGPGYNLIELDDGTEWYVFESSEKAGEYAREYWEDMANNDPKEFACMVSEEVLIQWGLGRLAGPGSTSVNSLQEWLDLWLDTPEEYFASYDGTERDCTVSRSARDDLNLDEDNRNAICYRHN